MAVVSVEAALSQCRKNSMLSTAMSVHSVAALRNQILFQSPDLWRLSRRRGYLVSHVSVRCVVSPSRQYTSLSKASKRAHLENFSAPVSHEPWFRDKFEKWHQPWNSFQLLINRLSSGISTRLTSLTAFPTASNRYRFSSFSNVKKLSPKDRSPPT